MRERHGSIPDPSRFMQGFSEIACEVCICSHRPLVKATHLTALTFHRDFIFSGPHSKLTFSMSLGDMSIPKYYGWLKSTSGCAKCFVTVLVG